MRVREVRAHLINTGLGSVFRVICTRTQRRDGVLAYLEVAQHRNHSKVI